MVFNSLSKKATPAVSVQPTPGVCAPGSYRTPGAAPKAVRTPKAIRPVKPTLKTPRFPVLPKGTLVKAPISWLRDHLLEVVVDPGPASQADRMVETRRREPERRHEVYRVKRCNITEKNLK
jgi:hypothetical protein